MMKTLNGCVLLAFSIAACANQSAPTKSNSPPEGGGADTGQQAEPPTCTFVACGGATVSCSPGMTCPRGDGCNTCQCSKNPNSGKLEIQCTTRPCNCAH